MTRTERIDTGRTAAVRIPPPFRAGARLSAANAVALGIGIASAPIVSRLFHPDAYGRYASYAAIMTILASLATGRFEQGVFGLAGRVRRMDFAALGVGAAVAVTVTAVVVAGTVAALGGISASGFGMVALLAAGVALMACLATLTALRVAAEHHDRNATARVAQSATQNAVQVLLGLSGVRSAAALVAGLLAGLAGAVTVAGRGTLAGMLRRMHPGRWGRLLRFGRAHASLPLRSAPAAFAIAVSLQLPVLLVTAGAGASAAGEFSMAQRLLGAPMLVLALAVGQVALGTGTRVAASSPDELPGLVRSLLRRLLAGGVLLTAVVVGGLLLLAEPVLGPAWGGVAEMAAALAPFALAQFVGAPLLGLLQVVRRQDLELAASLYRLAGLAPLLLLPFMPEAVRPAVFAYGVLTALAYGIGVQFLRTAVQEYAASRSPAR